MHQTATLSSDRQRKNKTILSVKDIAACFIQCFDTDGVLKRTISDPQKVSIPLISVGFLLEQLKEYI